MIARASFAVKELELMDKSFLIQELDAAFLFFDDLSGFRGTVSKTAHIAKRNTLRPKGTSSSG